MRVKVQKGPKSRFRIRSLRAKRSNLAFRDEIATYLSGTRNDRLRKGFPFLNQNLGGKNPLHSAVCYVIFVFKEGDILSCLKGGL
jgi:hypothetical protein